MAIQVTCPGCKASFQVSDKFAGKKGPCPKCKAPIEIPKPLGARVGAAAAPEVKIHAPEESSGAKTATGRPATRPLARQETQFSVLTIVGLIVGVLVVVVGAWWWGPYLQGGENIPLRAAVLAVVTLPVVFAGYAFLRDDELEPYRGVGLWLRVLLCGLAYAALWGAYLLLPADLLTEPYMLLVIAAPAVLLGGAVAMGCFDLDFGTACLHYAFYVLVTLALGWLAGLEMPWRQFERIF